MSTIRWLLVGVLLALVVNVPAPVAHAAHYKPGCYTFHGHWGLTEASVPITIGHTDVYVTRCWNRHGWITKVFGHSEDSETGPGKAAGWSLSLHDPYYVQGGTHKQVWRANGHAQICALFHVLLCGFDEDFAVAIHIYAPTYDGHRRRTMHPHCTNDGCHLKFHGYYP